MSADTCIAYFGLKFGVSLDEIEGIELRSDHRVVAARRSGLKYYWGNVGGLQESYVMFVGAELALLGFQNSLTFDIATGDLQDLIDRIKTKLIEAGFDKEPSLHLQWQPDV
jgi:hypothetical protein